MNGYVNIYGLLTKLVLSRWLDIAPSSFFCVFVDRDEVQYPAILTEQAWSIKDLLYGIKHQKKKRSLILRDQARNSERAV